MFQNKRAVFAKILNRLRRTKAQRARMVVGPSLGGEHVRGQKLPVESKLAEQLALQLRVDWLYLVGVESWHGFRITGLCKQN
jgi:hypothetical protein